jgi:hypothetical protein
MSILFALIPVMILAIAIATVPILYAMRQEERERRDALAAVVAMRECDELETMPAAA